MKWPKWEIAAGPGDFLPIVIGAVMLLISLPTFLLLMFYPDRNSGVIGVPLLILLGAGILAGCGFVVMGVRLCASPGTLAYRIAHGRILSRPIRNVARWLAG